jgi:streptomycin 6-kinase
MDDRIREWRVVVEQTIETESSILAFGQRDRQPVVLKVAKRPGDEWCSGGILDAFEGRGVVQVYDHVGGAALLERLSPGQSLGGMAPEMPDDEATGILAAVIRQMSPSRPMDPVPTVQDWGQGFERHRGESIPARLLTDARRVYSELWGSQSRVRLLHGDLHHANVLLDDERGWLAVDPKGVIGEVEFEIGAALRNPIDRPDVFGDPDVIRRRVDRFSRELDLNATRMLNWAFAQAVLATIWLVEDGHRIEPGHPWLAFANTLQPMTS